MSFLPFSLPSPSSSTESVPMSSPLSPSTHTNAHDSDSDHADLPVPPPVTVSVAPVRPARLPPPALNLDEHFLTPLHTTFIPRSERMYSPSTDALLDLLSLEAESAPSPWMLYWKEWGSPEHTVYDLDHDHPLRLAAVDTVQSVVKDRDTAESIVTYGLEIVCSLIERPEIADERISALDQYTLQHLCTFSVDLLTAVISNRPLAKQMHDYFVERVWWRRHSAAVSPSHKISSFVYADFFDTYS